MPRKVRETIWVGKQPPRLCKDCRLCGIRPKEDLPAGSRWTHICLLDYHHISGRGRLTTGGCSCHLKKFRRRVWEPKVHDGYYDVSIISAIKYQIRLTDQMTLDFGEEEGDINTPGASF